jgi:1,3-beta-galactosyl-N-acetylhexosamine phosphorylase
MGRVAMPLEIAQDHYLSQFITGNEDFGNASYVYPQAQDLTVIAAQGQHLAFTARNYGQGRAVYLGNLPFTMDNARLLQYVLIWLAQQESTSFSWLSANPNVDVAFYPHTNKAAAVNFSDQPQTAMVCNTEGRVVEISLEPYQWIWLDN